VVLEKDGEDRFHRLCERWIAYRPGGRNIQQAIKRRKANWIGLIFLRDCLLEHVIEGKIESSMKVTGR